MGLGLEIVQILICFLQIGLLTVYFFDLENHPDEIGIDIFSIGLR